MTGNDIPRLQNEPGQIRLRKAIRATFDLARGVVVLQAALAVAAPVAGAVVTLFVPEARPWVAAIAMLIILLDAAGLDRWQKKLLRLGARFGEAFDYRVLELPWDGFTAGQEPEPEELRRAEARYERRGLKAALTDWYPVSVGGAPLHLARLMCQRTNLHYDSNLRRSYASVLRQTAVAVPVLLVLATAVVTNRITDFLLLLATVTPLIAWCVREAFRQQDTADVLEDLMTQARGLWSDALADRCGDDHCNARAREFQSAIFVRRATATPILPGVYASRRAGLEDEMYAAAADFLAEYERAKGPGA
jgi:hypothetical protein